MENNSDNSTSSNFSDQSKEDQSDLPDEFTNLIQVNRSPSKFVNAIHFATQKFMLSKYWVIFLSLAIIINLILIICTNFLSEFEEIQFIGFDLDNTLINYHIGELCVLVFNSIMRYIVKQQDYNNSLLALSYDPKIILKGSVIDREKGNILKIDSKKQIVQAHHGTQSENLDLSIYDINELFRYEGNTSDRWWSIYSYFELSMASVYLNLVDQIDKNVIPKFPYIKIKELIFNSLLFNFLTFENGFYYREIEKNPSKYIKRSKKTQKLLLQFKKEKKIVFFITNSNVEYGKFVLKYALGENFSELFNFQVYHASKPRFFCERSPFRTTENTKKPLLKIELSGEYVGGNHGDLMKQFLDYSKKFQVSSKVAYFGDHLISDIKESKKFAFWKTILIIEEMNNDKSKEKWGSCFGTKEEGSTFMTKLINSYSDYVVINLDEFYDDYTSKKLKDNNIKKLSKN
ncbi:5'-nucleotidase domain-containing protein [Anaeramoeba flamelloides]|uniref:5'-nucleotidase domain-containing protein n=1 Tax=Anaeramoeba flamelloides TaxID=1746091 RepID=A0AAV7YNN7_9EUKA|nr:5'-nucleotidase domain-containing protein [Anaeramoeba flamelloides]